MGVCESDVCERPQAVLGGGGRCGSQTAALEAERKYIRYVSTRSGGACIEGLCGSRTVGARCCDEVRLELRGQVLRDMLKVTERVVQQRMQPSQRDAACARSRLDGVADRSRRLGDERAARHSAERVPQQKHELHVW